MLIVLKNRNCEKKKCFRNERKTYSITEKIEATRSEAISSLENEGLPDMHDLELLHDFMIYQTSLSSGLNKTNAQAKQNTTLLSRFLFFACRSNIYFSCLFSTAIISN